MIRALALAIVAAGCGGGMPEEETPAVTQAAGRNRLARETSPYLLQHADNPVDWYPWGAEALARARAEDKPILVSIGYSSCHWCHVMEHECFESEEIARIMNELFVCVKVDREERPDVDEIYMTAVQLMGVGGGWPLNVFLTPDGRPFFGGTYFPPDDRFGRPGWPSILHRVSEVWRERRAELDEQAAQLVAAIDSTSRFPTGDAVPEARLLEVARDALADAFDEVHGGFGGAPKFPPSQSLQLLLRRHLRTGSAEDLHMVDRTLRAMAQGGIHDQLGGGFHRYATDERWLVPHFEKMLYDNAQLARVYVEAWQVTSDEAHARIARETLDYVLREMTDPSGGFRSATDADSEGREGVYFVWRRAEIEQLLGEEAALFCRAYGVTEDGNFEDMHHPRMPGEQGMNVLYLPLPLEEVAARERMSVRDLDTRLAAGRALLFRHRQKRVYPGLDDKVIASWNGLMIGTFAYAGRALDEPRYLEAAARAADFVLREMRSPEGTLLRTWRRGEAKIPAFLEDHAFLASALLDLYEATFETRWLVEARALAAEMNRLFADESEGGWRHTAAGDGTLVASVKSPADGSIPGGNGVAAQVMLRLALLAGDEDAASRAERALRQFASPMERFPGGTIGLLLALDLLIHEDGEVAFVGSPADASTRALVRAAQRAFLPGTAFALLDPAAPAEAERMIPLLQGKTLVDGRPAAYVCRNYACRAPVTTEEALLAALAEL
ncbi:MAG: thioredoxin domain-containing protein [Candidatus Eiseniibacteriota bacterium]